MSQTRNDKQTRLPLERTNLSFVIEAEDFGVSVLGRLFARIYNKNLDTAIPLLVAEINSSKR